MPGCSNLQFSHYLSKEHSRKDHRKERLHCLYCMSEGHSYLSKTHISEKIPQSMYHSQWQYRCKLPTKKSHTTVTSTKHNQAHQINKTVTQHNRYNNSFRHISKYLSTTEFWPLIEIETPHEGHKGSPHSKLNCSDG